MEFSEWIKIRVADIVLVNTIDKLILLQQRAKIANGLIATPRGGVDVGETALNAGLRELHEETGLVIQNPNVLYCMKMAFKDGQAEIITFIIEYNGELQWKNNGLYREETDPFPSHIQGIDACYGHKWVSLDVAEILLNEKYMYPDAGIVLKRIRELLLNL